MYVEPLADQKGCATLSSGWHLAERVCVWGFTLWLRMGRYLENNFPTSTELSMGELQQMKYQARTAPSLHAPEPSGTPGHECDSVSVFTIVELWNGILL